MRKYAYVCMIIVYYEILLDKCNVHIHVNACACTYGQDTSVFEADAMLQASAQHGAYDMPVDGSATGISFIWYTFAVEFDVQQPSEALAVLER